MDEIICGSQMRQVKWMKMQGKVIYMKLRG